MYISSDDMWFLLKGVIVGTLGLYLMKASVAVFLNNIVPTFSKQSPSNVIYLKLNCIYITLVSLGMVILYGRYTSDSYVQSLGLFNSIKESCLYDREFQDISITNCVFLQLISRTSLPLLLIIGTLVFVTCLPPRIVDFLWRIEASFLQVIGIVAFVVMTSNGPNWIFTYLNYFLCVLSIGNFFFQTVTMIDLAYRLNTIWIDRANESDCREKWLVANVMLSLSLLVFSLSIMVYCFWEVPLLDLRITIGCISLLCLAVISVSITDLCPNASLLTACIVVTYSALGLMWAMSSYISSESVDWRVCRFWSMAALWASFVLYHSQEEKGTGGSDDIYRTIVSNEDQGEGTGANWVSRENELLESKIVNLRWWYFYFFIALSALIMICADWREDPSALWGRRSSPLGSALSDSRPLQLYILLFGGCLGNLILYVWTLVAPTIFPEREFTVD